MWIDYVCIFHKTAILKLTEMKVNAFQSAVLVFLWYLKHPCSRASHQCRGMDHAIPQNGQQQLMVHRVCTGKKNARNHCSALLIDSNAIWQILQVKTRTHFLTRAPQTRPSGCSEGHGTTTGSSWHPPGNPPATCDPPPDYKQSASGLNAKWIHYSTNAKLNPAIQSGSVKTCASQCGIDNRTGGRLGRCFFTWL